MISPRSRRVGRRRARPGRRSGSGRSRRARRGRRARRRSRMPVGASWIGGEERRDAVVVQALLDADRALGDRGQHLGGVDRRRAPRRRGRGGAGPAMARKVAAATPSASLRSRVSTLPRNSTTREVRPAVQQLGAPAQARGADDAAGGQRRERGGSGRDEGVARVLARQRAGDARGRRAAASACPSSSGRRRRCGLRASAASISRVKRPLPPSSESGRSCTRSPVVRIGTIAKAASRQAVRRHQPVARLARLGEGERAAAGADTERAVGRWAGRRSTAGRHERLAGREEEGHHRARAPARRGRSRGPRPSSGRRRRIGPAACRCAWSW